MKHGKQNKKQKQKQKRPHSQYLTRKKENIKRRLFGQLIQQASTTEEQTHFFYYSLFD